MVRSVNFNISIYSRKQLQSGALGVWGLTLHGAELALASQSSSLMHNFSKGQQKVFWLVLKTKGLDGLGSQPQLEMLRDQLDCSPVIYQCWKTNWTALQSAFWRTWTWCYSLGIFIIASIKEFSLFDSKGFVLLKNEQVASWILWQKFVLPLMGLDKSKVLVSVITPQGCKFSAHTMCCIHASSSHSWMQTPRCA